MTTHARGFSLIELMISVLIGTLAMIFVMRTTIGFETDRRNSIGGSDSMQNAIVALFSMENDAAQAGWGLNDSLLVGCAARFFDSQNYANANTGGGVAMTLAPVSVVFNGANPDAISFFSGTSDTGTGSMGIAVSAPVGSTALSVEQIPFGFKARDALAIAPTATGGTCATPNVAGSCCTIAQVSAVVQAPPTLNIASDGTTATRFNSGAGLLAAFAGPSQAKVFNLGDGSSLQFHTWDVNGGVLRLRATELGGASNAPTSAVSGIVSIKALYGFDTRTGAAFLPDQGLQINRWSAGLINVDQGGVALSVADAYQRLAAVRLAVVARSRESAKPDSDGICRLNDSTSPHSVIALPTVFASQEPAGIATVPIQVNVAVAGDPVDWTCYRYRVSETIVPLRNSGWRP